MLTFKQFNFLFFFTISFWGTLSSQNVSNDFMDRSPIKSAIITDYEYKDTIPSECGLIRLKNGKVVFMTRHEKKMTPFYIKAIETGYWDTRYESNIDYNSVFSDMVRMGANTAYVMIHWEEIEPSDNCFNFTFTDSIEKYARNNGIKINWVLFLHAQYNGVPLPDCTNSWTFHLDDRDSCNYTMQWAKQNGVVYKDIKTLVEKGGIRPLHVYGHKEIFYRIKRMLRELASHYRNSDTVIGVQLGNEEGFSFLDESDYNPVTAALYEEWKLKTNKTDYAQFNREAMNWWWKQFTTAFHEVDPYKMLSTNLDAGQAEAGDELRMDMTGTSTSFYEDGNLDVIGTMLYKQYGYKAIKGLDKRYDGGRYSYELPILVPSEIGIGRFNKNEDFNSFVMHTLERAAQGFGVYCYGEVRKEHADSLLARRTLMEMFANIEQNEDIIFGGLPGPGYVRCFSEYKKLKISHLNIDNRETLVMIYVPTFEVENEMNQTDIGNLKLFLHSKIDGKYEMKVYKSGKCIQKTALLLDKNKPVKIAVDDKFDSTPIFIKIKMK